MTTDSYSAGTPTDQPEQERPADPRPAWERVAYTWLDREVDHAQPVDPNRAGSRGQRCARVRRRPGAGAARPPTARPRPLRAAGPAGRRPDHRRLPGPRAAGRPAARPCRAGAEVGTTATVARQWLHTLRAGQQSDRRLAEPAGRAGQPRPPDHRAACTRCRLPTPTVAAPSPTSPPRRAGRWSASSSSTATERSPVAGRSTRPRSPARSASASTTSAAPSARYGAGS